MISFSLRIMLSNRDAERRKVNILEMKYLRRLIGVSRFDRVRNEEVPRSESVEMVWAYGTNG